MQSISDALNRLHEDASWFARALEVELFVVQTSGDLRKSVVELLPKYEFHHDNKSAWVVLEDAHLADDGGWQARANRLLAEWERRREAFLNEQGLELPAAVPARPGATPPPLQPFEASASAVLQALRAPLEGLVIVLAPTVVDDVEALGAELWALMTAPPLRPCRWVLVVDAEASAPSFLEHMGPHAIRSRCVPDPEQQREDFAALVADPQLGRAGPRGVDRPPRVDDPPPLDPAVRDQALREAGIDPRYLEKAPDLARLALGAALAMKEGRGRDAVKSQREARDLAAELGLRDAQVICQIALATYLSGLDLREPAIEELRSAADLAARHDLGLREAQARLALGLLLALDRRFAEAAREYAECARRAEGAGVPLIAIEGWRLAGQIGLQVGGDAQAAACFREAIRVAEGSEVDMVKASSAADAARTLAKRCQERGLRAQADSLYAQADAMERGEVGVPAPVEPQPSAEA